MMNRIGFTLIEVLVAMVILGFAVLGVQASITDRFVRDVSREDQRAAAQQLAADRLTAIQNDPQYTEIISRYEGAEDSVPGFPAYSRSTAVNERTGHLVVSVQVVTPTLKDTVSRTLVIGAP